MNGVNWVNEVNRLNGVNWLNGMNLVGRVSCVNGMNGVNGVNLLTLVNWVSWINKVNGLTLLGPYTSAKNLTFPNYKFGKGNYAFYPIKLSRFAEKNEVRQKYQDFIRGDPYEGLEASLTNEEL